MLCNRLTEKRPGQGVESHIKKGAGSQCLRTDHPFLETAFIEYRYGRTREWCRARRQRYSVIELCRPYGRLIQTIGTFTSKSLDNQGLHTWGLPYISNATETPTAGAVEVWQIFNLTGDTHPIHFHLVNVQLVQRQAFTGSPDRFRLVGKPMPPDANEIGWKETVRMNPGEVTTVIIQFTLPTLPPSMGDPVSPRTGGHEYVWHYHILEHEEHDMMRPLVVS
jgi:spore coat protein A, manganese oxidase